MALAFAPVLGVFAASVFLIGFCAAAFGLARHSFMTTRVPLAFRARALSLLGGTFRLGMFIGPFIAAGLLTLFGDERATIWFFAACLIACVLLVLLGPDPEKLPAPTSEPAPRRGHGRVRHRLDPHRHASGSSRARRCLPHDVAVPAGALAARRGGGIPLGRRSARQVVLPLWGVSIGLDAQTIALVVGISGAIDFALFYASGQVMDRFGRLGRRCRR